MLYAPLIGNVVQAPVKLRELVIDCCYKFRRFPSSIGCLKDLRKIVIKGSWNLDSLPEEFCRLHSLEHLKLSDCRKLSSLPSRFGDLTNLQHLDLSHCSSLRRVPVSFKKLISLKYLNFVICEKLMLGSEDFQNITKLEHMNLSGCRQLEELPENITNHASLRELFLNDMDRLKELPIKIDQLSRLREIRIGSDELIRLPNSLGNLHYLTNLSIVRCPKLESLPTSLGKLCSLTDLTIERCQLDFGAASLYFALTNLMRLSLEHTGVCRVSFSEDHYPRLQRLYLSYNADLREITTLPVNLEFLSIRRCRELEELPSFTRLTSLRDFKVEDCDRIGKIEGLGHCTRLETLILWTDSARLEASGIESLENLRKLELRAERGSVIQSCIQKIQKWPDEVTVICTRAVPEASSVVEGFELGLSGNLSVDDSFSNNSSNDTLAESKLVVQKQSSTGNAIMLCFIVNGANLGLYLRKQCHHDYVDIVEYMGVLGEGRWAVIAVLPQSSRLLTGNDEFCMADEIERPSRGVERGLAVRGAEQRLGMEALLPLLRSISI